MQMQEPASTQPLSHTEMASQPPMQQVRPAHSSTVNPTGTLTTRLFLEPPLPLSVMREGSCTHHSCVLFDMTPKATKTRKPR